MHVSALLRSAPVRALRIRNRRLVRTARRALRRWTGKPSSDPIRTFSVPSGFSAARPSLTLAITATALIACTTVVMGTFLAAGPPGAASLPPAALESAAPVGPIAVVAAPEPRPQPPDPTRAPSTELAADPEERPAAAMSAPANEEATDPQPAASEATTSELAVLQRPAGPEAAPVPMPEPRPPIQAAPAGTGSVAEKAEPALAAAPANGVSPPEGPYAGVWVTDEKACSPQLKRDGLIPALISSQGAWAGETTCSFRSSKRVGNTWTFAATCSDSRRRWNTTVRMSLSGNRLTWTSKRGTQTYVRCHPGLLQAHSRAPSHPPV